MIKQRDSWQEVWGRSSVSWGWKDAPGALNPKGYRDTPGENSECSSGNMNEQKCRNWCFAQHHGFRPGDWGQIAFPRALLRRLWGWAVRAEQLALPPRRGSSPAKPPENKQTDQNKKPSCFEGSVVVVAAWEPLHTDAVTIAESDHYQRNTCLHACLPPCRILGNAI